MAGDHETRDETAHDTTRATRNRAYGIDSGDDIVDHSKWIWIGIALALVLMVVVLWAMGSKKTSQSWVHASHILIQYDQSDPQARRDAMEFAGELRQRIVEGGEAFSAIAEEYSEDPGSGARGGDLGRTEKGEFVGAFEEYVWSAPYGEVSEIVPTQHGLHLIVVHDRHLSEADAYEQEMERRARQLTDEDEADEAGAGAETDAAEDAPAGE